MCVRIALVLLTLVVAVYVAVRLVQRGLGGQPGGTVEDPRLPSSDAEEAYRRKVRERAERQRKGLPEPTVEPPPSLVHLDDDVFECNDSMESMAEYFVVVSAAPTPAVVAAVTRAGSRFMRVDETGVEHADQASANAVWSDPELQLYTPNYVAAAQVTARGVEGYVDCKGVIPDEMGRRFRLILREELETLGVPSRVVTQDP